MGVFFLLAGTVLFFAGLGCLLIVFVSIARRIKANINTSVYFRARSSPKNFLIAGAGVVLIVVAQGFYWFNNQVSRFMPFDESMPRLSISFLYEEYKQPRMLLKAVDQTNQLNAQVIPFEGGQIWIGVDVVKWEKVFKVLGMKDCYHINGIFYQNPDSMGTTILGKVPDYNLNGGPSDLWSVVTSLGTAFPAKMKMVFSTPIITKAENQYSVQISADSVSCVQSIGSKATASK